MPPIKAKKSLGQNFLIDETALSDIADALEISGKHIIEVGPGYGALTDFIVTRSPLSLDLVELDRDMIELLEKKYHIARTTPTDAYLDPKSYDTESMITLHHTDVLRFSSPYEQYSVIANIPYYITSPILFHFLYDLTNSPDEMLIMMQEEVGEKILGGRERKVHHSFLSLCMEEACSNIEIVRYVGRTSFDPIPRVDSIVMRFTVNKSRNREQEQALIHLWKVAFAHPRKTLLANIKGSPYNIDIIRAQLNVLGYDDRVRAEAIRQEDWISFL